MMFKATIVAALAMTGTATQDEGAAGTSRKNKTRKAKSTKSKKNLGLCPGYDVSFTDYQTVDLEPFILEWTESLENDAVPSLTAMCKHQTAIGCARGGIDLSSANNNGRPRQVLIDTDFNNEVDDYLAVAWALLSSVGSSAQVDIVSIVAAPFSFRNRFRPYLRAQKLSEAAYGTLSKVQSDFVASKRKALNNWEDQGTTPRLMRERDDHATWCPDRAMEESYQGIVSFLHLFSEATAIAPAFASIADTPVFRGQSKFVTGTDPNEIVTSEGSEGVKNLIERAREASTDDPLFIVSIGCPTNVASALLIAPEIVGKIVVVWDAGWGLEERNRIGTGGFNAEQDPLAVRILFESGVRMLYIPGFPVGKLLQLSTPDAEAWFKGQGAISDVIYQRYLNNPDASFTFGAWHGRYNNAGTVRILWDTQAFGPFILPGLMAVNAVPSPRLQKVVTVPNTCAGYQTLGTTCQAYYPSSQDTYTCHYLDPYNLKSCNDAFYVDAPPTNNEFLEGRKSLVQAIDFSGLPAQGGAIEDLLLKLKAAGV